MYSTVGVYGRYEQWSLHITQDQGDFLFISLLHVGGGGGGGLPRQSHDDWGLPKGISPVCFTSQRPTCIADKSGIGMM